MSERVCPACGAAVPEDQSAACPQCGEGLTSAALPAPAPVPVPVFEVAPYRAASGTSPLSVLMVLAAGLIAALLMGALASGIGRFFYLVFLFPLAIGLAVGGDMAGAAKVARMHSPVVAGLLGLWCGVVAMVAKHFSDYLWLMAQLPDDVGLSFVGFMDLRATHGVSISGLNLGYYGSIIYWLLEVALVAGVVFACCIGEARQPFCPSCDRWKKEKTYGPYYGSPEAVRGLVQGGELAKLAQLQEDEGAALFLVVANCFGCGEEGPIDVKLQQLIETKDGTSMKELCHTTYPGEALAIFTAIDGAKT